MPETESLALTLPIRRLVEFLLRSACTANCSAPP